MSKFEEAWGAMLFKLQGVKLLTLNWRANSIQKGSGGLLKKIVWCGSNLAHLKILD